MKTYLSLAASICCFALSASSRADGPESGSSVPEAPSASGEARDAAAGQGAVQRPSHYVFRVTETKLPAPLIESDEKRRSTPLMVTGIVLFSLGGCGVGAGATWLAVGDGANTTQGPGAGDDLIAQGAVTAGVGLAIMAVALPLWIYGAQSRDRGERQTSRSPVTAVSPSPSGLRLAF